jgi:hypothetical protein
MDTSIEHFLRIIAEVSFCASIVHTILPPWDWISPDDNPRLHKLYKIFVYVVGYVAMNARTTAFKELSINNPDGVNTTGITRTTKSVPVETVTEVEVKKPE